MANNLSDYTPGAGEKRTVVTTGGGLAWNVGCVMTTGSGSGAGHWVPKPSAMLDLVLAWKGGSGPTC